MNHGIRRKNKTIIHFNSHIDIYFMSFVFQMITSSSWFSSPKLLEIEKETGEKKQRKHTNNKRTCYPKAHCSFQSAIVFSDA